MELARGEPRRLPHPGRDAAHDGWLAALLEGFEQADDVAVVFGPHDARPEASHMIKAEMERHFANWGEGREIDVQRLDRTPEGLAAYRARAGRLTFLSDVNCCIARWAWERVPYREVPLRRGPAARPRADRGRLREGLPPRGARPALARLPARLPSCAATSTSSARCARCSTTRGAHRRAPHACGRSAASSAPTSAGCASTASEGPRCALASAASARHHTLRMAGAIARHARRPPARARARALSLEGRDHVHPCRRARASTCSIGEARTGTANWGWEFVRRRYPAPARRRSSRTSGREPAR